MSYLLSSPGPIEEQYAELNKRKHKKEKYEVDLNENWIIMAGPVKAMAKAGEVWSQIGTSRQAYQSMVDIAFDTMGGNEGLAEAIADDEEGYNWHNANKDR